LAKKNQGEPGRPLKLHLDASRNQGHLDIFQALALEAALLVGDLPAREDSEITTMGWSFVPLLNSRGDKKYLPSIGSRCARGRFDSRAVFVGVDVRDFRTEQNNLC